MRIKIFADVTITRANTKVTMVTVMNHLQRVQKMNKVIEMMIVNDLNNDVHKEIVVILSPFMTVL